MNNHKAFGLLLCASLFLAHCGAPYQMKSLRSMHPETPHSTQTDQDVTVRASLLSYYETKELFNGRGNKLRKRGSRSKNLQPVLISVQNNSPHTWVLSSNRVSLDQAKYNVLYNKMKYHPVNRALVGIGGTLLSMSAVSSLVSLIGIGICFSSPAGPVLGTGLLFAPLCTLIGGSVATSEWAKKAESNNHILSEELQTKVLMESEVAIAPNRLITKLIFVQQNHLPPQFKITLENESYATQKLPFYVDLERNLR